MRGTPIVFDLEGHSVTEMYSKEPKDFIRLGGAHNLTGEGNPFITDNYHVIRRVVHEASVAIGHNILAFDLPALGIKDLLERTKAQRVIDTWTLATVMDPPPDSYQPREGARRFPRKPEEYKPYYALDNLAFQYGVPGKSHSLKELAKERGDASACCLWGSIPVDDEDYRTYLRADVEASRTILGSMLAKFGPITDYAWREMRVAAVCSTLSMNGFRLDRTLTDARIAQNDAVRERNTAWLVSKYNIPLVNKAGKPSKNPVATDDGKKAILAALYDAGVRPEELARTPKGSPSLGADSLLELAKSHKGNQLLETIVETVGGIQGLRTVYQTALDNVHADGFCHPDVFALQASGRLSLQNPGLTVFGKRGGRHIEREIFTGDVLWGESDDPHVLFSADFSQIDARMVAAMSQDYAYLDKFENGRDLHMENAITVWGPNATAEHRELAKPVGHGWNYGMGLSGLSKIAGEEIARQFIGAMERTHPRLVQWKQEQADIAARYGQLDNGFGRIMKASKERAWTQGPALKGQGGARDAMFEAILKMDHSVVRMIKALVHDELVFSCPISIAKDVRQHVVECMTFEWAPPGAQRAVKIIADATDFGFTWGSLYAKK